MEKLFNLAFLEGCIGLFFARLFFVIFHFRKVFLNPLVFFLFPYFPGLSLAGGVLGGLLGFFYLIRKRKMPIAKLFDFFSLSFLAALPLGYLGLFLLEGQIRLRIVHLIIAGVYLVMLTAFLRLLLPLVSAGKLKDGELGIYFTVLFSCISIIEDAFLLQKKTLHFFGFEDVFFFIFLILAIASLLRNLKFFRRYRKSKK